MSGITVTVEESSRGGHRDCSVVMAKSKGFIGESTQKWIDVYRQTGRRPHDTWRTSGCAV